MGLDWADTIAGCSAHPTSATRQASLTLRRKSTPLADDLYVRDRHDELPAPRRDCRHLADDLVLDVPRKDQDVVRPGLEDAIRRKDRNVRPRCELAVFVLVFVDGVIEKIG